MSQIKVDQITDEAGTGAPDFPNGIVLDGASLTAVASQAEAEDGTDATKLMTPQRVEQHMLANALGWGQAWSNPARSQNTDYVNTTGRPIMVAITIRGSSASSATNLLVGGVTVTSTGLNDSFRSNQIAIVPNGATYRLNFVSGTNTIMNWSELS
jgi:hypothetical protein